MPTDRISFEKEISEILNKLTFVRESKEECNKKKLSELILLEEKLEEQYDVLCDEYIKFCEGA